MKSDPDSLSAVAAVIVAIAHRLKGLASDSFLFVAESIWAERETFLLLSRFRLGKFSVGSQALNLSHQIADDFRSMLFLEHLPKEQEIVVIVKRYVTSNNARREIHVDGFRLRFNC